MIYLIINGYLILKGMWKRVGVDTGFDAEAVCVSTKKEARSRLCAVPEATMRHSSSKISQL